MQRLYIKHMQKKNTPPSYVLLEFEIVRIAGCIVIDWIEALRGTICFVRIFIWLLIIRRRSNAYKLYISKKKS